MRICFVYGDYSFGRPLGSGGGIDTYTHAIGTSLALAGHEVHVITRSSAATRSVKRHGVHIHLLRCSSKPHPALMRWLPRATGNLEFSCHAYRCYRRLEREQGKFDIVEAAEFDAGGWRLSHASDVPLVVKCHAHTLFVRRINGRPLTLDSSMIACMERRAIRCAKAVNANSRFLARECARDTGVPESRFARVAYGIDTNRFRPTGNRLRTLYGLEHKRVILFPGRMERLKGIVPLVYAYAELAHRIDDSVLLLAGSDCLGPPGDDGNIAWMTREWEKLGVPSNRFIFLRLVPNARLPEFYTASDLVVAPSLCEAFGIVYLEAMACGRPPIGCGTGGIPEVISDARTGILVPPNDAERLAEAMFELLNDTDRRHEMSRAARDRVEAEFTVQQMSHRTLDFYRRSLA